MYGEVPLPGWGINDVDREWWYCDLIALNW